MIDYSNTSIIDLAAIVAEHLQYQGIEGVLVGGLAVEIYTENLYLTKGIDMVNINYQSPKLLRVDEGGVINLRLLSIGGSGFIDWIDQKWSTPTAHLLVT